MDDTLPMQAPQSEHGVPMDGEGAFRLGVDVSTLTRLSSVFNEQAADLTQRGRRGQHIASGFLAGAIPVGPSNIWRGGMAGYGLHPCCGLQVFQELSHHGWSSHCPSAPRSGGNPRSPRTDDPLRSLSLAINKVANLKYH